MSLTPAQLDRLSQCFLFRDLPPKVLPGLTGELTAEACAPGQVIYSPTRYRKAMGVVLEGRLSVLKGRELLLKVLGPGQCFGAAALFCPDGDYVTTIRARTAGTLVFLPDHWLVSLFEAYPRAAVAYITFLSQRVRFLNRKIDRFTAPSVRETVLGQLLAVCRDGVAQVDGGYSGMAKALNIGRASLYRALDSLEEEGRIRREGRRIYILEGSLPEEGV